MEQYAGIDVSLESASICVVDAGGRIVREAKVASEPEALIGWFGRLEVALTRIGLEAGPLSQWLYAGMREAGLTVELLETRHVRDAFKAMPVKTDRTDARGAASLSASSPPDRNTTGAPSPHTPSPANIQHRHEPD
jgi:transposase